MYALNINIYRNVIASMQVVILLEICTYWYVLYRNTGTIDYQLFPATARNFMYVNNFCVAIVAWN